MKIKTKTVTNVAAAEEKCGSDHVPITSRISLKQQKPVEGRPIPKWLAKHDTYNFLGTCNYQSSGCTHGCKQTTNKSSRFDRTEADPSAPRCIASFIGALVTTKTKGALRGSGQPPQKKSLYRGVKSLVTLGPK